jgi:hypothetical protein
MYSILIKDKSNLYRFLTVKQDITKEETKEVTDDETQEVKTETVLVPTGETEVVVYATEDRDELEKKCIELLNSYKATDFIPVDTLEYSTDLIWREKE